MRLWPDAVWRCIKCEKTELHKQLWHYPSRTAIAKRSYELRHKRSHPKKKLVGMIKKRKLVPREKLNCHGPMEQ